MKRSIRCTPRPPPGAVSTRFPPPQILAIAPRSLPSAWTENRCPAVIVRGTIFNRRDVEVECRVSNKLECQIRLPPWLIAIFASR
jgi:hypothetical protein